MILYITVAVISLILSVPVISKRTMLSDGIAARSRQAYLNMVCLLASGLILATVSLFRINTGNDYVGYIEKFHDAFYNIHVVTEPGFNIITKLVYWFTGYEAYLVVFAIFSIATVAVFIAAMYRDSRDYLLTFFLFMCFGYYFQSLNTMRYYLALAIVLYSLHYVRTKRYVAFVVTVVVASMFHKSSLVVIPLFIIARLNLKRWHYIAAAVVALSGLVLKKQYLALIVKLYPTYVNEQEALSLGSATLMSIIRIALVLACALYIALKNKDDNEDESIKSEKKLYFNLNYMALLLYTCFSFVPYLSRIGYFLIICQIYYIPMMIASISNDKKRKLLRLAVIVCGIVFFGIFLYKAYDISIRILPYHTWLGKDINFIPVVEYNFFDIWK